MQEKGKRSGAGYECRDCTNLTLSQPIEDDEGSVYEDDTDTESNCSNDSEELESEVITDTFNFEDDNNTVLFCQQ